MSSSDSGDEEGALFDQMFPEPPRPATPPPTTSSYTFPSGSPFHSHEPLQLQLIGQHHSLWGHVLFNSSIAMSDYMVQDEIHIDKYLREKRVLEFGAGGSVPSLVAGVVNARDQVDRKGKGKGRVISTDYPDDSLLENIRGNVRRNGLEGSVEVEGFVWGRKCDGILEHLKDDNVQEGADDDDDDDLKFDTLLLSDLIFNHSQHIPLIHSMMHLIRPHTGCALVFHSHHLPQWRKRDLHFFKLAKNRGFSVTKVLEEKRGVQFEKDAGDKAVRERVWGWELKWDGVLREEDSDLEDLDGKPDGS